MRKAIFFLVASLSIAACDNDHPTAPQAVQHPSSRSSERSPSGEIAAANAKPAAFTITTVKSASFEFGASGNNFGHPSSGTVTASCPAGSTVIGGGYYKANSEPEKLNILSSDPAANSWSVRVRFAYDGAPAEQASIYVTAVCIQ